MIMINTFLIVTNLYQVLRRNDHLVFLTAKFMRAATVSPFWWVWKMRHVEVGKLSKSHTASSKTNTNNSMPVYSDSCVYCPGVAPAEDAGSMRTCCSVIRGNLLCQVFIHAGDWSAWPGLANWTIQHEENIFSSIRDNRFIILRIGHVTMNKWIPVALKYCKTLQIYEHCEVMETKAWPQFMHEFTLPCVTVTL